MPQATIENLKNKVKTNSTVNETKKTVILDLLETLKPEIDLLAAEKAEHAMFITGFVEHSTDEAMQEPGNPTLLKLSIDGLKASVVGFETSHPQLVKTVNTIAEALASMGI